MRSGQGHMELVNPDIGVFFVLYFGLGLGVG